MDNKITPIDVESAVVQQETFLEKRKRIYNIVYDDYHYTNIIYKFNNRDDYGNEFDNAFKFLFYYISLENFKTEINIFAYTWFNMLALFLLDTFYILPDILYTIYTLNIICFVLFPIYIFINILRPIILMFIFIYVLIFGILKILFYIIDIIGMAYINYTH